MIPQENCNTSSTQSLLRTGRGCESHSVIFDSLCPMDCTVHGLLQARVLEWVAISFSRGYSQPREKTQVSCIAGRFFTSWATWEAQALHQGRGREDPISFYDAAVTLIPKDSKAKEGRDKEKEEERNRERERERWTKENYNNHRWKKPLTKYYLKNATIH